MPRKQRSGSRVRMGKLPARRDARNIAFAELVRKAPRLPAEWDFDTEHVAIPTPMFGNDVHGDCVIAGRAHQTLRFEWIEQSRKLAISTADVLREWRLENGNTEDGLVVLDSLKAWRTRGWEAAGRTYRIAAFTEVGRASRAEVKRAIVMQAGIGIGLLLPADALAQFDEGRPWDVSKRDPTPVGGHYVYVVGYTRKGPVCVTWGKRQPMTWAFFERFCDEAYAIVDARDEALRRLAALGGALDLDRLAQRLGEAQG